ncbi:MmcQ/YjbR family DNA-binding protein [Kineosporia mesophila]|uniref:MmcQ/YjbR family DNA-binding protein n=1 Tax=Kineosporia mesophila TaxID=566012 RepID=UPI001E29B459|nr:MmcQ/YjbR family DNA-binding protein [Kineosporia mesophila]
MAHPTMFEDCDPLLARVRELALGLPDAAEKISHGRPAFCTTKVFAYYGGSVREAGEWVPHDHAVLVPADPDSRTALEQDPRCFVPAYRGPSGYIGLDLEAASDWEEVAELLQESYRLTAGTRRVARLGLKS